MRFVCIVQSRFRTGNNAGLTTKETTVITPDAKPTNLKDRSHGLWWTFGAALVAVGAAIIAIAQNSQQVRLHYIVWEAHVSLIVVVLTTALLAVLLDEAGGLIWRRRKRSRLGRRDELALLRSESQQHDGEPAEPDPPLPQAEAVAVPAPLPAPDI